jgi:hypothetical protein
MRSLVLLACTTSQVLACGEAAPPDEPILPAEPYSIQAFDRTRINSRSELENYQRVYADLDLHDGPFASVTLSLDLDTTCFPFTSWATNPPPTGQRWPADCDAFDRLFQVTIDPAADGEAPGFEVLRAVTPFGGPAHLEVDVTDLANALAGGVHELEVYISTSSDPAGQVTGSNGGWFISGRLDVTPGPAPRTVLAAIPLVHRTDTMTAQPAIPFAFPAGTTSGSIEYRVTGHGGGAAEAGCIGPAEEFCNRAHEVFADDQSLARFQAWITSCAQMCDQTTTTYCRQNPTGNVQSVRAPRANWCPGAVTDPELFTTAFTPGDHSFRYDISRIAPSGRWTVSATAYAYGD